MPREPNIWVVDTSILVGYLRAGRHGEFLRREIARGGVFLPGVVLYADALVAVTAALFGLPT